MAGFTICFHDIPSETYQQLTSEEENGEGSAEGQCQYIETQTGLHSPNC